MTEDQLQFENAMVLAVVQALLGAITPTILAVALAADVISNEMEIFVAVDGGDPDLEDLLEQIETDIEALTGGSVRIRLHLWSGETWSTDSWPGRHKRLVFARATNRLWTE